jgi:GDP-L-fucose synthase
MVGRALVARLQRLGYAPLTPSRTELDLRSRDEVRQYFERVRPKVVFMLAARVGSIAANIADQAGFLADNARINLNTFEGAALAGTKRAVYLGSSCLFPRESPQPMREDYLMTGPIEPTNEGYGIGKLVGLKLADYYRVTGLRTISLMPAGVYGPGDHFDMERSHVLAALVRRFVDAADADAESVTLWGSGNPRREFIHVEDVVSAVLYLFDVFDGPELVNVGTGRDISIRALADMIAARARFGGTIAWDTSRPDGMPCKLLDVERLTRLGFACRVPLDQGIAEMVEEYRRLRAPR